MRWIAPSDNSAAEFRPQGLAKIVVARVPLDMGTPVTEASIKLLDYPASALLAGAFTTTAQLTTEQRVALNRIEANEPVLLSKLSGKGGRASISALLAPDQRAAAVRVNDLRPDEHPSELQSLMRLSYAVFSLTKKQHLQI